MTQTRTLLAAFAALALGATPAFAQSDTVTTQTPPAPNAQSFTPQPQASVPAGAATVTVWHPRLRGRNNELVMRLPLPAAGLSRRVQLPLR